MLQEIVYFDILGKPLIMYLGIITVIFLLFAASIAIPNIRKAYKINPKWHPLAAKIAIFLALVHGILGLLAYF